MESYFKNQVGACDREVSSVIATMSLMRHDSDYDDYIPIDKEDLDDMIPKADKLIVEVKNYLEPKLVGEDAGE